MKKQLFNLALTGIMLLIINACGTTSKLSAKKVLSSHPWEISTLNGTAPDLNEFRTGLPFLLFGSKGQLTGSTGCNNMSGNYKLKKDILQLEPGAITRMACQGNGEALFLDAIRKVKNFKIDGDKLTLLDGTKEIMTLGVKK
jgi:heat shock protein HslJ